MALYRAQYPVSSASYTRPNSRPASVNEMNEEMASDCGICLESLQKNLAALRCGHVFHHTCVEKALALRHACPVCRHKASPNSTVRLYLSVGGAVDNGTSNYEVSSCRSRNEPTIVPASRLPERMNEMRRELDRMFQIQRMTSSHSFRLENNLVRRRQELDESTRRLQHIQRELDSANAQTKSWQRIATTSYAQASEARRTKAEMERKVHSIADRMLQKIRERRRLCRSSSCANEWSEMAKELATAFDAVHRSSCCARHGHRIRTRDMGMTAPTSRSQTALPSHQCDYSF